jgi:NADH dehydrogenase/putative oxidoreductase
MLRRVSAAAANARRVVDWVTRAAGGFFDLALRIALAAPYLLSGLVKVADWDKALYLAAHEYPVTWLSPPTAALLGTAVEVAGGMLLVLGLATRAAAFAMAVLAVVIQTQYVATDTALFWTALLAGYVIRGAGSISIDRMIAPGLATSPLPLAATSFTATRALTRVGTPLYLLGLRAWLGATLIVAPGAVNLTDTWSSALPLATAPAALAAAIGGAALAMGLATRIVAVLLLSGVAGLMLASSHDPNHYWIWALAAILMWGPGQLSVDAFCGRLLQQRLHTSKDPLDSSKDRPRIVIVGAGFGGLAVAAALRHAPVSVTVIDRHNYHLFQPLLYQVATAGLSPGDIATPIRGLFRDHDNVTVLLGEVTAVDPVTRTVTANGRPIAYDYLVLATGASHSYFGQDAWAKHAPGLKRVEDAIDVRRRLLLAFEQAEVTDDETERQRLLTFLVVGGGPTGVELAGAIAELSRHGMAKEFRRFDPAQARVVLVQSGARVLPQFPEALSAAAARSLEHLGVELHVDSRVQHIDATGVTIGDMHIAAGTVLWAAGVVASPAASWLHAPADSAGRLIVGADLSVPEHPNIFAIGDTASANAWAGRPIPGLAPAAKQCGSYVARVIRARVHGQPPPPPFRYSHLGSLATIGRQAAVADFGFIHLRGAPAWWLWGIVHVGFLVGLRNRVSVMFDWFWAYLTLRSGTRLITGAAPPAAAAAVTQ